MQLKDSIAKIIRNKFIKGVFLISGGTALAQVITILGKPIITRIYTPEEYGVLSVYISIITLLSIVSSFKYEWAIPISKDSSEAINTTIISIIILVIFSISIMVIVLMGDYRIFEVLSAQSLYKYRILVPIGILFIGFYNIFNQWALRVSNYTVLARTKIVQSAFKNIVMIVASFFNLGSLGLILGQIIGQSSGTVSLAKSSINEYYKIRHEIKYKKVVSDAIKFKRFPIYSAPSQLSNSAGIQLPILFISSIYGASVIGYYGLANSIVQIPVTLIGKSVGNVFYSEAARIGRSNPKYLNKLAKKVTLHLFLMGLVPVIIIMIWGPNLFSLVFGEEWFDAGNYARIISILVFSKFIFTPISMIYTVFEEQKKDFMLNLTRLGIILIVFFLSYYLKLSSYKSILIYSISMTFIYFITYIGAINILKQNCS